MSKKVYIESYGCQMNVSDSEVVASILAKDGYEVAATAEEADLVLLNTCSVREKAEYTVMQRINEMNRLKATNKDLKVGVLGCMAERMKENLLVEKKVVDLVVGPDAYRSLPQLLDEVGSGQRAVNVLLSREETYGEIVPVRLNTNGVTAFVTIMRGCDNMCAFCVVPFTRGRERSRDAHSIVAECRQLVVDGYKEVTLLGQNVDSYKWRSDDQMIRRSDDQMVDTTRTTEGSGSAPVTNHQSPVTYHQSPITNHQSPVTNHQSPTTNHQSPTTNHQSPVTNHQPPTTDFADLLEMVATACPSLRIRYSTSHPKDMTDKVLEVMARYGNICKYIHLPVQSGSSAVLKKMNRGYDRDWYLKRVASIRKHMPDCAISTDIIVGFCGETEEDHQATLDLMAEVGYDMAYMFKYSERPKTLAARKLPDDVPAEVKSRRLTEIIEAQKLNSAKRMASYVGQVHEVLVEGVSKRSEDFMYGRNTQNSVVIVPREVGIMQLAVSRRQGAGGNPVVHNELLPTAKRQLQPGDLIKVRITSATAGSLQGEPIEATPETVAQA